MNFLSYKRVCELKAPFALSELNANDWTHFTHLHRRSHLEFRLLHKAGDLEIFLYKSRLLYPFPFHSTYLTFRRYRPEVNGYDQVYLNVRSGDIHYLNSRVEAKGDHSLVIGEWTFRLRFPWKMFPRLFAWLFTRRMRKVMDEDNVLLREEIVINFKENKTCAPQVPEAFDFMTEMEKVRPAAEGHFQDHVFEDLTSGTKRK